MKLPSILFPGVVLGVGVVYAVMAWHMPRGSVAYPGPGFFPVVVGFFLVATAMGCLIQELLKRRTDDRQPSSPALGEAVSSENHLGRTFQLMALMIGYILALTLLGFPVTICIFLVVSIRIFGSRQWIPTIVIATIVTVLAYVSFVLWLKVPLPLGILQDVID